MQKRPSFLILFYLQGVKFDVRSSSSRKSLKKLRRESQQGKDITRSSVTKEEEEAAQVSSPRSEETQVDDTSTSKGSVADVAAVAPRDKVIQACTVTSGLMAASGLIIRTVKNPFESFGFCKSQHLYLFN